MYREYPNSIDAEQALVGLLIVLNEKMDDIPDFLLEKHFYYPLYGSIYSEIKNIIEEGHKATPITLWEKMQNSEALKKNGGKKYLIELAVNAERINDVKKYAKIIYETWRLREIAVICEQGASNAYIDGSEEDSGKQIENIERELYRISDHGGTRDGFQEIEDTLMKSIEQTEYAMKNQGLTGISTGFAELDKKTGGFKNSDLIILAARPSMGKTALGLCLAYYASKAINDGGVVIFSLEMSSEQLATRLLAIQTGINSFKISNGQITNEQFSALMYAKDEISKNQIGIDDTPALSISALRTRARRLKRKGKLSLIVVDYLQLLHSSKEYRGNRVQEISEISSGLKAIAKELDVPVIALSQLSRALEQREDKRPILSDLRESGSIEQDADVVMFLYREEYYLSRTEPKVGTAKHDEWLIEMDEARNVAEVFIAKQRNGHIGNVKLRFEPQTTKFTDLYENKDLEEVL